MLLEFSKGYTRHIELINAEPETFHYVGDGSPDDLKELIALDEDNMLIYGRHLIDNYEELTE